MDVNFIEDFKQQFKGVKIRITKGTDDKWDVQVFGSWENNHFVSGQKFRNDDLETALHKLMDFRLSCIEN